MRIIFFPIVKFKALKIIPLLGFIEHDLGLLLLIFVKIPYFDCGINMKFVSSFVTELRRYGVAVLLQ